MSKPASSSVISTFKDNEPFLILCVQVATLHIGQGLITPILPLYAQTFAVSITLVGFLLTSQSLPRVFINLPTGRLADKWGAHRTMALAAAIVSVSAIIGGLAPNYFVFLLTRLLQGVGTGMSQTSGFTYAASVSRPENRARFVSLYQGSFLLGGGIGPVIGGVTAQYFGFRAPFFVYAFCAILVCGWMLWRLPDPRQLGTQTHRKRSRPPFLTAMRQMMGHRAIIMASLIGFMAGYIRVGTRHIAVPLQGDSLGFSESQIGLALSALFLMTVVSLMLTGALADRFGRKMLIVPSWLFVAGALLVIAYAPQYSIYILGGMLFGLAGGIGGPIPAVYVADAADEESQGTAIGIYRTFGDAGMVLGPLVMGWMIDVFSISTGLVVNATLIVLVAVTFWLIAPEPNREA